MLTLTLTHKHAPTSIEDRASAVQAKTRSVLRRNNHFRISLPTKWHHAHVCVCLCESKLNCSCMYEQQSSFILQVYKNVFFCFDFFTYPSHALIHNIRKLPGIRHAKVVELQAFSPPPKYDLYISFNFVSNWSKRKDKRRYYILDCTKEQGRGKQRHMLHKSQPHISFVFFNSQSNSCTHTHSYTHTHT